MQISLNGVLPIRLEPPRQEILEGAAPQRRAPVAAERLIDLLELQLERLQGRPEVLGHDLLEERLPVLPREPLDQVAQVVGSAHAIGSFLPFPRVLDPTISPPEPLEPAAGHA